jgi:hypothetical protein
MTKLDVAYDRFEQIADRAKTRRAQTNYADETHLVYLRFDLCELLTDIDVAIQAAIPPRNPPASMAHLPAAG